MLVQTLKGWQMISMATVSNITSVLYVSRFIPHVIKWCQHVHLQQLQQSWLIYSVVYFIIIVAPAEKSLVTLWPCCCKLPSPPNENEMALNLTRRQDVSYRPLFCSWDTRIFCNTSIYSLPITKMHIFIWLSAEHTLNFSVSYLCPIIWAGHDTGCRIAHSV